MTTNELIACLPLLILLLGAAGVLVQVCIARHPAFSAAIAVFTLVAAFISLYFVDSVVPIQATPILLVDRFALFFIGLILAAAAGVALLSYSYFKDRLPNQEEFYVVLLIATAGAATLAASNHFASLFLGLEALTVALYIMIAYLRENVFALEAALKYLLLAAASSAFLLFGMALIYAAAGTMEFGEISTAIFKRAPGEMSTALIGTALFLVGAGFKLAVVPFHMWTPDVYEGAPAPVTAFIATVSKGAVIAVLLRYFEAIQVQFQPTVLWALSIIAVLSMFGGNLLALLQDNIKRLLAYSSIAHLGYVLVALIAGGELGQEAAACYLVVYFVTTLGAFGILSIVSGKEDERMSIEDYRGFFWQRPWIAAAMTGMFLSLAGIPLTAGFIGKFVVISAGVGTAQWSLVLLLVVNSAIGIYYYLRVIATMFASPVNGARATPVPLGGGALVVVAMTIGLVYFGVYPGPLLELISQMVSALA